MQSMFMAAARREKVAIPSAGTVNKVTKSSSSHFVPTTAEPLSIMCFSRIFYLVGRAFAMDTRTSETPSQSFKSPSGMGG